MTDINANIVDQTTYSINISEDVVVVNDPISPLNLQFELIEKTQYIVNISEELVTVEIEGGLTTGTGDMLKNTYDTNFNGLVDTCEYVDGGTF
jgi:hypothetical protein